MASSGGLGLQVGSETIVVADVVNIARQAGAAIMAIYATDVEVGFPLIYVM